MALENDQLDMVKRWMLQQLRLRLRSAKVQQRLKEWGQNPGVRASLMFEFVLDEEVLRGTTDPTKGPILREEKL